MASPPASPCIVWFRDDPPLPDHPALHAAAHSGAPVICLFVFDEPDIPNARPLGGAARWWLAQSLRALDESLRGIGASLTLRKGTAVAIISDVAQQSGADTVFWNDIAQAPWQAQADQVSAALE